MILLALVLVSFAFLSTQARFTSEYSGQDAILVAKWNFGARGEEDIEGVFYNKGFTFDLFNAQSVAPMNFGEKSFTFTGGGSDVGIAYDVEMNVRDLLWLATGTVAKTPGAAIYAPFIFRITLENNAGAEDTLPAVFTPGPGSDFAGLGSESEFDSGWFRPGDMEDVMDEDGFFSIFRFNYADEEEPPAFSPGSRDEVTVTVAWQWNASFFINETGAYINDIDAGGPKIGTVEPDPTAPDPAVTGAFLPYYQKAYDVYYGPLPGDVNSLHERRMAAAQAVMDYLNEHGTPAGSNFPELGGDGDAIEPGAGGMEPGAPEAPAPEGPEPGEEGGDEPGMGPQDPEGQNGGPAANGGPAGTFGDGAGGNNGENNGENNDADTFDYEYYNSLVAAEYAAIEACDTSLMAAYDDYDTLAVDALVAKEAVQVIFRIKGEQVQPGGNIP